MKVLYVILLFALLFSDKLLAQSGALDYYKNTNLAELAICDSNFNEANKYYKKAFAINPHKPIYADLYNAFCSAIDTREYELAEKYFSQLSRLGIDSAYLNKLRKSYKSDELQQLNTLFAKYPLVTIKEDALVKKLKQMYQWDQGVRMYYCKLNDGNYMVDSVYKVDSINAWELKRIFTTQGIPGEAVLRATCYDIIILHNTVTGLTDIPSHIFDTLLFKAIFTFDYDARKFPHIAQTSALWNSFTHEQTVLNFPLTLNGCYYNGKIFPEYWDEPSENRMNEDRAKIGLEPLDDLRRKIEGYNKNQNPNSVLHKYSFSVAMTVMHVESEERLKEWLAENGKNVITKKSVFDQKFRIRKPEKFTPGYLSDNYVIGKTTWNEKIKRSRIANSLGFTGGQVPYGSWEKIITPVGYLYHVEAIPNPKEDLTADKGRYNIARFVPGYRIMVESGFEFYFRKVYNYVETIYDNNTDSTLISLTAGVDPLFYKMMIKLVSQPTQEETTNDTVKWASNEKFNIILKTRKYSWIKGGNKVEIVMKDNVNTKGKKYTAATLYMTDISRYAAYLKLVDENKKRLDKEYLYRN